MKKFKFNKNDSTLLNDSISMIDNPILKSSVIEVTNGASIGGIEGFRKVVWRKKKIDGTDDEE